MSLSIDPNYRLLLEAVAFSARAHQGQLRKDRQTPYHSHVFRVCLIVRDLFNVTERQVLLAAVLHDTLEDTTTDFDDLSERFGVEVARWVAALSKDSRLPEEERESQYRQVLASAPWQVQVCKLADMFDNLTDLGSLSPAGKRRALERLRHYLEALRAGLKPEAETAWGIVAHLHAQQMIELEKTVQQTEEERRRSQP